MIFFFPIRVGLQCPVSFLSDPVTHTCNILLLPLSSQNYPLTRLSRALCPLQSAGHPPRLALPPARRSTSPHSCRVWHLGRIHSLRTRGKSWCWNFRHHDGLVLERFGALSLLVPRRKPGLGLLGLPRVLCCPGGSRGF